jgi:hypothetical protein
MVGLGLPNEWPLEKVEEVKQRQLPNHLRCRAHDMHETRPATAYHSASVPLRLWPKVRCGSTELRLLH